METLSWRPLAWSLIKSTRKLPAILALLILGISGAPPAVAESVRLRWNPNSETDLAGYLVHYGLDPSDLDLTLGVGLETRVLVSGLEPGLTYHFSVSAFNTAGFESEPSQQVSYLVPGVATNHPPSALPASVSVVEDGTIPITLRGSDPDGSSLTYTVVTAPTRGTLSGVPPDLVYRPFPDFWGSESFSFVVNDGSLTSSRSTVSIQVVPVNDVPVAVPALVTVEEGGEVMIVLEGIDTDGDSIAFALVAPPTRGTITGTPPVLSYRPYPGYSGADSLRFTVRDSLATSAPADVGISVMPVEKALVTQPDVLVVLQGEDATALEDGLTSVLANDPLPTGGEWTAELIRMPLHGAIELRTDGSFLYQHDGSPSAHDSFTYVARDASRTGPETEVSIFVFGIQDVHPVGSTDLVVGFPAAGGRRYRLEYQNDSPDPAGVWRALTEFTVAQDSDAEVVIRDGASLESRFYRAVWLRPSGDLTTEVWGHRRVPLGPLRTDLVVPFQGPVVRRTAVAEVTPSTLRLAGPGWAAGEIAPRDGRPSHVVMVTDGPNQGEWWPVSGHDATSITLSTAREDLSTRVVPGTVVEVVRLVTVADVLGAPLDPNRIFRSGDLVRVDSDARSMSWSIVDFSTNSAGVAGYTISVAGTRSGPYDGSTLSFLPAQTFSYSRGGGIASGLLTSGRVQNRPIMHYASTFTAQMASAFPVRVSLAASGLVQSGWRNDVDLVVRSTEDDLLYFAASGGVQVPVIYHAGPLRTAGWYTGSGFPAGDLVFSPGLCLPSSTIRRATPLRWSEPVPWNR